MTTGQGLQIWPFIQNRQHSIMHKLRGTNVPVAAPVDTTIPTSITSRIVELGVEEDEEEKDVHPGQSRLSVPHGTPGPSDDAFEPPAAAQRSPQIPAAEQIPRAASSHAINEGRAGEIQRLWNRIQQLTAERTSVKESHSDQDPPPEYVEEGGADVSR